MSTKVHWREASTLIIISRSLINQSRTEIKTSTKLHENTSNFNYKVLTLMRSKKTSFMPGGYVFPGGAVDKADSSIDWISLFSQFGFEKDVLPSVTPAHAKGNILQSNDSDIVPKSLSLRITAIRETFEECGILLCKEASAHSKAPSSWCSFLVGSEVQEWQKKVQNNPTEFLNLCKHLHCYPDVWSLQLWSNWLTPIQHRVRFDTAFFIATCEQLPPVFIDNTEIMGSKWCDPNNLLHLCDSKDIWLPPPQYYEVSRLKNFSSIDELSSFAKEKNSRFCERWMPVQMKTANGVLSLLPGDYKYPTSPVYESGTLMKTTEVMETPDDSEPLHRMELRGVDHTKIILRNLPSNGSDVLPSTVAEGEGTVSKL